jgi:L-iditol 2-dehydrogenase
VVVLGDGPIGLLHLQLSKNLYHARTAIVGKIPQRLQKAISLGADTTVMIDDNGQGCKSSYINKSHDVNTKSTSAVLQFTGGKGADIIIIATSDPAALDFALKVASKNSKINIFSGIAKDCKLLSVDPNWLHYNQISITGSFSSSPKTLQEALRLVSNGQIDLSKLIGRSYSLVDIEKAIIATEKCVELRAIINKF